MNAGAQDALNLSWKLGGYLKGWYDESVLDTYEEERKPEAQRIIDQDKTLSALITGKIPEGVGKPGANSFEILGEFIASTMRYTLGLDVHYEKNILNKKANIGLIAAGWPGPDVLLRRPGSRIPLRLHQVTKNVGRFHVLVFTGNPALTSKSLQSLRSYFDSEDSFTRKVPDFINYLTIIPGDSPQADHYLGVSRWGKAFYDADMSAACTYGFSAALGGVVVLRPDGILGYSGELGEGKELGEYFLQFVKANVDGPVAVDAIPEATQNESKQTGEIEFNADPAVSKPVENGVSSATETTVSKPVVNEVPSITETTETKSVVNEVLSDTQTEIPIRAAPEPIAA